MLKVWSAASLLSEGADKTHLPCPPVQQWRGPRSWLENNPGLLAAFLGSQKVTLCASQQLLCSGPTLTLSPDYTNSIPQDAFATIAFHMKRQTLPCQSFITPQLSGKTEKRRTTFTSTARFCLGTVRIYPSAVKQCMFSYLCLKKNISTSSSALSTVILQQV